MMTQERDSYRKPGLCRACATKGLGLPAPWVWDARVTSRIKRSQICICVFGCGVLEWTRRGGALKILNWGVAVVDGKDTRADRLGEGRCSGECAWWGTVVGCE